MYPDAGYKRVHVQSLCTSPFLPRREGPGDEATLAHMHGVIIPAL